MSFTKRLHWSEKQSFVVVVGLPLKPMSVVVQQQSHKESYQNRRDLQVRQRLHSDLEGGRLRTPVPCFLMRFSNQEWLSE